jgi:orotate phosphoribosyltransferase
MAARRIPKDLQAWIDARKRHDLSHAAVQMARELGMNPRTLGKIDNHKQERWKAPLPDFIADLYEKRFHRTSPETVLTIEEIAERKVAKKAEHRAEKAAKWSALAPGGPPKTREDGTAKLLRSLPARRGHFVLESGYHTDLWLSLESLFVDPRAVAYRVKDLARLVTPHRVSAVCGPLLGGAFLAQALARQSGLRFFYTERVQTSAGGLFTAEYRLPAGLLRGAAQERFAVVDDVISAGSSVRATVAALQSAGAKIVVVGALLVLGTTAVEYFASLGVPMVTRAKHDINLWAPGECPQCQAGVSLEDPVGPSQP